MLFPGPALYLAFRSSEIAKKFSGQVVFLFYLDNIPGIYLDHFFEVTCEIQKNIDWVTCSAHYENEPQAKNS